MSFGSVHRRLVLVELGTESKPLNVSLVQNAVCTDSPCIFGMSYAEYYTSQQCTCYEYQVYCKNPDTNQGMTWSDANNYCQGLPGGVGLATMDTEATFIGVKQSIPTEWKGETCNWGFWIGFKDMRELPHDPRHKTHPEFFSWHFEMCSYFEKWAEAQPNDNDTQDPVGQNCVQMWYRPQMRGSYDDEYCTEKKGFVCQLAIDCACAV
ncbi:lectin BRA-3-like [Saccoglossus kowalevskii]